MKKKNLITTSLAVILAVALTAGGTLAYLDGTSVTATNELENDFNWVSLTETVTPVDNGISKDDDGNITNTGYEIIPGTSQDKDPTVSVSYSVDSYVYVEVTDTSGGLITWAPADGWTLLESASDTEKGYYVYYRLVKKTDTETTSGTQGGVTYYKNSFSVLDGDSISYSSSITNSELATFDEDGDPTFYNTGIKLTFQAYIMQKDTFSGPSAAWEVLNGASTAATAADLKEAISAGGAIVLAADVEKANDDVSLQITVLEDVSVDFNGNTLSGTFVNGSVTSGSDSVNLVLSDSSGSEGYLTDSWSINSETVIVDQYNGKQQIAAIVAWQGVVTINSGSYTHNSVVINCQVQQSDEHETSDVIINGGSFIGQGNGSVIQNTFGNVEINGGYFKATNSGDDNSGECVYVSSGNSYLGSITTINGGTFEATKCIFKVKEDSAYTQKIYVTGGTFKVGENGSLILSSSSSTSSGGLKDILIITGGTFNVDPSDYVADGYTATKDETEGTWTVTEESTSK